MTASPMAAIRNAVATILESDPQLMVTQVFNDDMFVGGKAVCYPYVASMSYDTSDEARRGTGLGTAEVDIFCNAVCNQDPAKKGVKTEAAADIISRIKYRLETYDVNKLEVSNDGRYNTHILAIAVDGNVGDFDDGSGKIRIGVSVSVVFGQSYSQ